MQEDADMKLINLFIASMVMFVGLVGCAHVDYVKDAAQRVKAADWSKMETVSIALTEYAYSPSTLVFQKDVPYKLEIINQGTMKHYFTAQNFFTAIATRKVQSSADGEIKAPYFLALAFEGFQRLALGRFNGQFPGEIPQRISG